MATAIIRPNGLVLNDGWNCLPSEAPIWQTIDDPYTQPEPGDTSDYALLSAVTESYLRLDMQSIANIETVTDVEIWLYVSRVDVNPELPVTLAASYWIGGQESEPRSIPLTHELFTWQSAKWSNLTLTQSEVDALVVDLAGFCTPLTALHVATVYAELSYVPKPADAARLAAHHYRLRRTR